MRSLWLNITCIKNLASPPYWFFLLRRLTSFQRGTVGFCRSTGCKDISCQSWRFDKKFCPQPKSNHTNAAQIQFLDNRIILQVRQLLTLQPIFLQRPTVALCRGKYFLKNRDSFPQTLKILPQIFENPSPKFLEILPQIDGDNFEKTNRQSYFYVIVFITG